MTQRWQSVRRGVGPGLIGQGGKKHPISRERDDKIYFNGM